MTSGLRFLPTEVWPNAEHDRPVNRADRPTEEHPEPGHAGIGTANKGAVTVESANAEGSAEVPPGQHPVEDELAVASAGR